MDPQYFGLLDPDPQKYPDPRGKYQPKTAKKVFYSLILKTQEKKENYEKLRDLRRPQLRRPELSNKNIGP